MNDLISRAEAIEAIEFGITNLRAINIETGEVIEPFAKINSELKEAVERVKELPSAQRTGKWIYGNEFHWYIASCNKCGYQRRTDIKAERWNQWNYCPNCGARMVEDE